MKRLGTTYAKVLENASGYLNTLFTDAEIAMRRLELGVEASISLNPGSGNLLVFGLHDGQWHLMIAEAGNHRRLLVEAPTEYRVLAAQLLPKLQEKMEKIAQEEIGRIEAAIGLVRTFLSTLEANES